MRAKLALATLTALAAAGTLAGCGGSSSAPVEVPGGHAANAPQLVEAYGCGSCHAIAGITGADGTVGPSLAHFAKRRSVAGKLQNTPHNLVRWIVNPQAIEPGTLMPDLDVGIPQARDIAAYLYSH